jgi:hypothetical protein
VKYIQSPPPEQPELDLETPVAGSSAPPVGASTLPGQSFNDSPLIQEPKNTYVPARFMMESPQDLHRRRTNTLLQLGDLVTDLESNGAPADTRWVSFADPGSLLTDLYEAEATLEKEDAADALEAVRMAIRALHVGLRLGRDRDA